MDRRPPGRQGQEDGRAYQSRDPRLGDSSYYDGLNPTLHHQHVDGANDGRRGESVEGMQANRYAPMAAPTYQQEHEALPRSHWNSSQQSNASRTDVGGKRKVVTMSSSNRGRPMPGKRYRSSTESHALPNQQTPIASRRTNSLLPPLSDSFDDLHETKGDQDADSRQKGSNSNKDGASSDVVDDEELTEDEEISDKSTAIFIGKSRYFVPRDRLEIQADYASDGFGLPPLGSCVFDFKHSSSAGPAKRSSLPSQMMIQASDIVGVGAGEQSQYNSSQAAAMAIQDTLNLPRAFRTTPHLLIPSPEWRRVWSLLGSKLIPKEVRRLQGVRTSRESQRRRVGQSIVKHLRKLAEKNFRGLRDAGLRARRLVRDMQVFWRKHEKELTEARKKAEKVNVEKRRTDLERLERERQQKKLEFLLTQTELFSHFIGKKMGILPPDSKKAAPDQEQQSTQQQQQQQHDTKSSSPSSPIMSEAERVQSLKRKRESEAKEECVAATRQMLSQHYQRTAQFDHEFSQTQAGKTNGKGGGRGKAVGAGAGEGVKTECVEYIHVVAMLFKYFVV
eukprot:jgi/Bigna1/145940/aug1.106_g20648